MKIAILYIATGRYTVFWEDFYNSCEKYFLPNHEKTYFFFTDDKEIEVGKNVIKIHQEFRGWPYDTLLRFETFLKAENELKEYDYIYFLNANLVPVVEIGDEILPSKEQGLMVTIHPGFYNRERSRYPYDNNPESLAYVPDNQGKYYFMGCFNGGTGEGFLKLIQDLAIATQKDLEKGIIALWHDESQLNKYVLDKSPLILPASYAFPEGMPFNKRNLRKFKNKIKLLIKDKSNPKYGGHDWLRGINDEKLMPPTEESFLNRIKNKFNTFKHKNS